MVKCIKCTEPKEYENGYYICEDCKVMRFEDISAARSFLEKNSRLGYSYADNLHNLLQKRIIAENTLTEDEETEYTLWKKYSELFRDLKLMLSDDKYSFSQDYRVIIGEKLYEFNQTVIALKNLYP